MGWADLYLEPVFRELQRLRRLLLSKAAANECEGRGTELGESCAA